MHFDLETMEPTTARAFAALHRTIQLHHQFMAREMAKKGTHPAEAFCLRLLTQNDGISQRDLATRLHLSRPWITRLLQGLEKSGLVTRRVDEQDQRLTRVFLTEKGREREAELRAVFSGYLDRTLRILEDDEKLELERILGKLNACLADQVTGVNGTCAAAPFGDATDDATSPSAPAADAADAHAPVVAAEETQA